MVETTVRLGRPVGAEGMNSEVRNEECGKIFSDLRCGCGRGGGDGGSPPLLSVRQMRGCGRKGENPGRVCMFRRRASPLDRSGESGKFGLSMPEMHGCGKDRGRPNPADCPASGHHDWTLLGKTGRDRHLCRKCKIKVAVSGRPSVFNCPEGGHHQWDKL